MTCHGIPYHEKYNSIACRGVLSDSVAQHTGALRSFALHRRKEGPLGKMEEGGRGAGGPHDEEKEGKEAERIKWILRHLQAH